MKKTETKSMVLLHHHLKSLKLPTMHDACEKIARRAAADNADHLAFLLQLCELELIERERRAAQRRLKAARFPNIKTLESFDFSARPSINKTLVLELMRGEYIARRENILLVGNTQLSEGCYLLRTNLTDWTAKDLWKTYIQLTQAEAAFRTQKSELNLRPIWHHKEDRVQAHILFSFLAYAMWKMLELWMSRCGLGNGPRPLIEEFERIKANDVVLPTSNGREVRIRCVTQLDESQRILLGRLGLKIPARLGEPQWSSESQM